MKKPDAKMLINGVIAVLLIIVAVVLLLPLASPSFQANISKLTNQGEIEVTGKADKKKLVWIEVSLGNKKIITSFARPNSEDGSFAKRLMLVDKDLFLIRPEAKPAEGVYTIRLSVKNTAGKESNLAIRNVLLDNTPPALMITYPPEERFVVGKKEIELKGIAEPGATLICYQASLLVSKGAKRVEKEVHIGQDGNFSQGLVLGSGENRVTLRATDRAGNQSLQQRIILLSPGVMEQEKQSLGAIGTAERMLNKAIEAKIQEHNPALVSQIKGILANALKAQEAENYQESLRLACQANMLASGALKELETTKARQITYLSIRAAEKAIDQAVSVRADKYASSLLAEARQYLKEAGVARELTRANDSLKWAQMAKDIAVKAESEARREIVAKARQEVEAAKKAIDLAITATAERYAPGLLKEARSLLAQAEKALGSRLYIQCLDRAVEAKAKANNAQKSVQDRIAALKEAAKKAIGEAETAFGQAIRSQAELYANSPFRETEAFLFQARKLFEEGGYEECIERAKKAREKAQQANKQALDKQK